jgi:hypothetical protein
VVLKWMFVEGKMRSMFSMLFGAGVILLTERLEFINNHNKDPRPFVWHKTADQILDSIARFCTRKRAGIDALVRGSSTRFFSSQDLDWNGVCLEFHDASPTERSEASSADHVIALFTNHRARGESEISPGRFAPYSYSPGAINVFPAGSIPACRPVTPKMASQKHLGRSLSA